MKAKAKKAKAPKRKPVPFKEVVGKLLRTAPITPKKGSAE
jgi:hypothetical protein